VRVANPRASASDRNNEARENGATTKRGDVGSQLRKLGGIKPLETRNADDTDATGIMSARSRHLVGSG